MTIKGGLYAELVAVMVAIVIFFLPECILLNTQKVAFQICMNVCVSSLIFGWTLILGEIIVLFPHACQSIKIITSKAIKSRRKIAVIFTGHGLWGALSWVYNNPIYMAAIAKFGPIVGGVLMTIGSLVICFGMLFYYRNKNVSWLGYDAAVEALSEHVDIQSKAFAFFGDIIAFFALSLLEDPFLTTAYLRHGRINGLFPKDYAVFISSVIVSNGYWILRTTAIIEVAKYVWHLMF